jgi:hypothetical protein
MAYRRRLARRGPGAQGGAMITVALDDAGMFTYLNFRNY